MRMIASIAFCHKDRQATMELVKLLADLEPKQNVELDLLLVCDSQTDPIPEDYLNTCMGKFRTLQQVMCTVEAGGYWPGANALFHFTANFVASLVKRNPAFVGIKAWLNLESDCVPLRKDWHAALSESYDTARKHGKFIVGNIIPAQPNYQAHVNGVAVYPTDLADVRFGTRLLGCSPLVQFDVHYGPRFVPNAFDDNSFFINWKVFTIGKKELFTAPKGRIALPTWYHGVKDASARNAVREKLLEGNDKDTTVQFVEKNPGVVFTYYEELVGRPSHEEKEQIECWKRTWIVRGFTPKILNEAIARQHPKYAEVTAKIAKFPTTNNKTYEAACYLRWLALAVVGGGLLSDYDVVNSHFTKDKLEGVQDVTVFYDAARCPCVSFMTVKGVDDLVSYLLEANDKDFVQVGGKSHCSDMILISQLVNKLKKGGWRAETDEVDLPTGKALMHVSTQSLIKKHGKFASKSSVMQAIETKNKQKS